MDKEQKKRKFKQPGLTNDVEYTFQVRAVNSVGIGDTAEVAATPTPLPPPSLSVEPSFRSLEVGWNEVTASSSVTGYRVESQSRHVDTAVWPSFSLATETGSGTRSYTHRARVDSLYRFRARTLTLSDSSAWSEAAPAVGVTITPNDPSVESITLEDGEVEVTWGCPNWDWCTPLPGASDPVLRMQWRRKHGSAEWTGWEDVSSPGNSISETYPVSGLEASEPHLFQARAVNASGGESEVIYSPSVFPLRAEAGAGSGEVDLSWDTPPGDFLAVQEWHYRQRSGGGVWGAWQLVSGGQQARSQPVSGLVDAVYGFQVQGVDGGNGSEVVSFVAELALGAAADEVRIAGPLSVLFAENGTDTVATYRATDALGGAVSPVTWTLLGADAGAFEGMRPFTGAGDTLRFKQSPDFENPADADGNRVYTVRVQASAAGRPAADTTVSVTVTNVPEAGMVSLSSTSPQEGVQLRAEVSDPDASVSDTTWQWQRRARSATGWTDILDSTQATYTPTAVDVDNLLQATASYLDGSSADALDRQEAESGPTAAVRTAARWTVAYGQAAYTAPEGGAAQTVTVTVSPAGDRLLKIPISVGRDPATEAADYTVSGLGAGDTLSFPSGVLSREFRVRANPDPDRDDETVRLGFGDLPQEVGAGSPASAVVTLEDTTLLPVTVAYGQAAYTAEEGGAAATVTVSVSPATDRALRIPISVSPSTGDFTLAGLSATDTTLAISSGAASGTFTIRADADHDTADETVTLGFGTPLPGAVRAGTPPSAAVRLKEPNHPPDPPSGPSAVSYAEDREDSVATYRLTDPNPGDALTLEKNGPDAAHFRISGDTLYFADKLNFPDFEGTADADRDDIYVVHLWTRDSALVSEDSLAVSVTVTNVNEPGQVDITTGTPQVGRVVSGTVTDPDGDVNVLRQRWEAKAPSGTWVPKSAEHTSIRTPPDTYPGYVHYTPTAGDVGKQLRVTAIYRDGASVVPDDTSSVTSGPTAAVRPESNLEIEGASDTTFAERATGTVATYRAFHIDDGTAASVGWSLLGADADSLAIDSAGRLSFNTPPDYEEPADANRDTVYQVTVRAVETGAADSAFHAVSVKVTNADDPGVVTLSVDQPRVGVEVTAELTDQDGGVSDTTWMWQSLQPVPGARGAPEPVSWMSSFTPGSGIAGLVLRARVDYDDAQGSGKVAASAETEPVLPVRLTAVFDTTAYEATEGGSAATVGVTLSPPADRFVRIPIRITADSGTEPGDYSPADTSVVFSLNESEKEFTVTAKADTDRDDETATLGFGTLPLEVVAGTPASAVVTLKDVTPACSPPEAPSVTAAAGDRKVDLTWSEAASNCPITDYQYRVGSNGVWTGWTSTGASTTSKTVTGLTNGTPYSFQVRAVNSAGIGAVGSDTATPCGKPGVPSVTAAAGDRKVDLTWSEAASNGCPITDYQYRQGSSGSWMSTGTTRNATVTGLSNGTSYTFYVRAVNSAGTGSTGSDTATPSCPPPGVPTVSLTVPSSGGHKKLNASWTVPASCASITGYTLESCYYAFRDAGDSSGGQDNSGRSGVCSTTTFGSGTTSTSLSGLHSSTLHGVRVQATSGEGTGAWSTQATATTRANTAPEISGPTPVSVAENTTFVASYTVTDADGDGVSWSRLEGDDKDDFNFSGGALSFRTPPDYESGTTQYDVTVKAADDAPSSKSGSKAVTVNVTDIGPPGTPTVSLSVPASGGHKQLNASWTVPASGASITGYTLESCYYAFRDAGDSSGGQDNSGRSGVCSTTTFGSGTTSTSLSGLHSSTLHGVRVQATSGEGTGAWSTQATATTRANTAPEISGPTPVSVAENTTFVASYTVTDADGDGVSWSRLEGDDKDDFNFSGGALSFRTPPDYESGTTQYDVTVKAADDAPSSKSGSKAVTVNVTDIGPPGTPTNLQVTVPPLPGALGVSWTAPSSGAPITGYGIKYCYYAFRDDGGSEGEASQETSSDTTDGGDEPRSGGVCTDTSVGGTVTSTSLTDLHTNTLYGVRVRASSGEGDGDWTTERTTTTRSAAAKVLAEQLAANGKNGLAALAAPNPFNPSTTIYFQTTGKSPVSLVVYNLAGQVVKTLITSRTLKAGIHEVFWEGRDDQGRPVAAGVYLYRITAGEKALTQKITLLQ